MFNTTGSDNTASGVAALEANTSGAYNTANGAFALNNNTSGANNVANGYQALYDNTSGANNAANGYQALWQNQNGSANVANGFQALFANLTGSNNVANGFAALNVNNSGSGNVAEGYEALLHNMTGSSNVAVGFLAGANITGSDNIDIGNAGAPGDNGIIRIGTPGTHTTTYLAGDVSVSGSLTLSTTAAISSGGNGLLGGLCVDANGQNPGNVNSNALVFGGAYGYTGEGIASKRSGANAYDLEFYTDFANRMTIDHSGNVWVGNNLSTATLTIRGGSDVAEPFPVTGSQVEPGTVMVIDEANPGQLMRSTQAYDTRVAGIISGANGISPGIAMQQEGAIEGAQNVALSGRVYVQVDKSNGAIEPGDLLTTSATPGRAMKVIDHARAQGAIIGKAMTALAEGKGMVLVLVSLQ